jgi:hypothetical protein
MESCKYLNSSILYVYSGNKTVVSAIQDCTLGAASLCQLMRILRYETAEDITDNSIFQVDGK